MLKSDSKMCILSVKFGGRMVPHSGRIWLDFGDFCFVKNQWPNRILRRPNSRTTNIRIAVLGLFSFNFLGVLSTINISLVSDDYVCRKQGLETNIQTRVYREFLLATNTRVGIVLIHLEESTIRIESLGHGKRLGLG